VRKVVYILVILTLSAGCTVSKRMVRSKAETGKTGETVSLSQNILSQNLTSRNFYVEKAGFKISSDEGEQSGMGYIKFLMPDKFLICLKSNAGIEAARIYISGDSIYANDRFNKKLYYGSTSYLKSKYGLTTSLLPVTLGDYVNDERLDSTNIKCKDGKLNVEGIVKDVRINYIIDCETGKSLSAVPKDEIKESVLEIRYSNFLTQNGIKIPGLIEISEQRSNIKIEIRIQKVITPWEGKIEFIPGKQFKKIHLL
jgi:hypothetical protein